MQRARIGTTGSGQPVAKGQIGIGLVRGARNGAANTLVPEPIGMNEVGCSERVGSNMPVTRIEFTANADNVNDVIAQVEDVVVHGTGGRSGAGSHGGIGLANALTRGVVNIAPTLYRSRNQRRWKTEEKSRRHAKLPPMAPTHPLTEVFGFTPGNMSDEAVRHRAKKLCPFNNKVPNCTKDKASDPLGTCSVKAGDGIAITCPIRFRENWIIADDGADFLFSPTAKWTSLTEVRLKDKEGKSAGNIDLVLVSYNDRGKITDFGALEIQAVYISGNIRKPFEYYMQDPKNRWNMNWKGEQWWPAPDYLSSSRKRLAPQLIFKSGILHAWKKKTAVALDAGFFATLPKLKEVPKQNAELAWFIYDLHPDKGKTRYALKRTNIVYTEFQPALDQITKSEAGDVNEFVAVLQEKLDEKLNNGGTPPNNQTIDEVM